ncbi:hypothetical protein LshimejAT787_0200320 [Lyophyllum shimeji]|uniref:Uncharacterized protein n=1 Tax=Lyophyllum shimeji TaxID=47721 RepID=A0A9P3UIN9_LYOSH|nr:hypothetical protein LshimejAT787_0200320 [Lyophyllum shimeji]
MASGHNSYQEFVVNDGKEGSFGQPERYRTVQGRVGPSFELQYRRGTLVTSYRFGWLGDRGEPTLSVICLFGVLAVHVLPCVGIVVALARATCISLNHFTNGLKRQDVHDSSIAATLPALSRRGSAGTPYGILHLLLTVK